MSALFVMAAEEYNQRSLVVVLRGLLYLRASTNMQHLAILIAGMRWIEMNGFARKFPHELGICRSFSDEALANHHNIETSTGRTTSAWWEIVKTVAHLAFDAEAFSTCVNHEGNWFEVSDQLTIVMNSETSKSAFSEASSQIEGELLTDLVKNNVKKLLKKSKINKTIVAHDVQTFLADAELIGIDAKKAFVQVERLEVVYRGTTANVPCTSYHASQNQAGR